MTAVPSSITERVSSNLTESENTTLCEEQSKDDKGNKNDGSDPGKISDSKMVKVCDKLIGVFLVDKPTTTDWRRLLAFSREWSNIRPHFYNRCQERADSESDPGRKHKLLRLSRKLKEVFFASFLLNTLFTLSSLLVLFSKFL